MKDIDEIIIEVLSGRANPATLSKLEAWIGESEQNEYIYQEILDYWYTGNRVEGPGVERILGLFQEKIEISQHAITSDSIPKRKGLLARYRFHIAAVITLLIATTTIWYYFSFFPAEVSVKTAFGEKKDFNLPDMSEVVLNANSQIRYHRNNPREIWLEGEAFFTISKMPEKNEKFLVHTEDLTIEVLGTTFNVNSHMEQTKVYLEEGKIKLDLQGESNQEIMLEPGDLLTYSSKNGGEFQKIQSEASLHTSWRDGSIILDNIPLGMVLKRMEEIYGVKIELLNETLKYREVTLAIPIEDLSIALSALENVLGQEIKLKKENEYMIQ